MRNYVDGIGTRSLDNFSNRTIRLERLTLVQIKYGAEEIQSSLILSTLMQSKSTIKSSHTRVSLGVL